MRRIASHYIYLPGHGYLKRYAVELSGEKVKRLVPCLVEEAFTEWLPGVLMLHSTPHWQAEELHPHLLDKLPDHFSEEQLAGASWKLTHLYPFDFTSLKPADETQHRQLL